MAVLNESASFVVSLVMSVVTFSGMQMARPILASTPAFTILGGFLGSVMFMFLLTAIGNLERTVFGKGFQTKLFESCLSLVIAVGASASVHRVSATTCILFSIWMMYAMNKISHQTHNAPVQSMVSEKSKKKK